VQSSFWAKALPERAVAQARVRREIDWIRIL
jgi:hypothetical protein